jgi:nicotinamide-nucleotide adenylyltransferase
MTSKKALFIGRFQPFHNGHLHALQGILNDGHEVIMALGSTQESHTLMNPLTVKERKEIIKSVWPEVGEIYEVPDINSDEAWVNHVEEIVPEFGPIYSGSEYVQKLFREHGGHEVIPVDFLDGVSATMVRDLVIKGKGYEEFLPKATYEYLKQMDFAARLDSIV